MERFVVFVSVCVYVSLCMGGRLQLVMRGYGEPWEQCSAISRPFGWLLNFSSGLIGKRPFWAKS